MNKKALHALSLKSGVPFHTLRKLQSGETSDPKISTVERLLKHAKQ